MFQFVTDNFLLFMKRGGWVMWPLGVLSILAVALVVERSWFWIKTNNPWRLRRLQQITNSLRRGERAAVKALAQAERSIYGRTVLRVVDRKVGQAAAAAAIDSERSRLERFMPTLSTIITAAPLLGILGTVTGLIQSFNILAQDVSVTDPRAVASAIGEALLTTAVGLAVSILVLFPYNGFRAQVDRTLNRFEVLIAAASELDQAQQLPDEQRRKTA